MLFLLVWCLANSGQVLVELIVSQSLDVQTKQCVFHLNSVPATRSSSDLVEWAPAWQLAP